MPVANKHKKSFSRKTVIVTKSKMPAKSTAFAQKLKKVNDMLDKTKWLNDK